MWTRVFVVWCAMLVFAVLNGALREVWMVPAVGPHAAHAWSAVVLAAGIAVIARLSWRWTSIPDAATSWRVGAVWVLLTLAFEFLAGHYVFGAPWRELLADYNIAEGRLWILVLVATLLTPVLIFNAEARSSRRRHA